MKRNTDSPVLQKDSAEKESLFNQIGDALLKLRTRGRKVPFNVSIYSDASFVSKYMHSLPKDYPVPSQSAHAFWIVSNYSEFKKSGMNPYPLQSPIAAEVLSILKGIKQAIRMARKFAPDTDHLKVHLLGDCKEAMRLVRSGKLIPWQRRLYTFLQRAMPFEVTFKYLPAHVWDYGEEGRRHAWCDLNASRHNKIERSHSERTVFLLGPAPKKFWSSLGERMEAKHRKYGDQNG